MELTRGPGRGSPDVPKVGLSGGEAPKGRAVLHSHVDCIADGVVHAVPHGLHIGVEPWRLRAFSDGLLRSSRVP